ncbi:MAG: MerR family transcriptional regulator [Alphaproteobacteria bacterium]
MALFGIAIGELSRRTGCKIETIRYYERIDLLPIPARRGRYRRYGAEDVGRLAFIRQARGLGFTLDEVRALLRLAIGGQDTCAEVRSLAATHLAEVRAKIGTLRAMEDVLDDAVRRCDAGETPGCPLIEVLSSSPDERDAK